MTIKNAKTIIVITEDTVDIAHRYARRFVCDDVLAWQAAEYVEALFKGEAEHYMLTGGYVLDTYDPVLQYCTSDEYYHPAAYDADTEFADAVEACHEVWMEHINKAHNITRGLDRLIEMGSNDVHTDV